MRDAYTPLFQDTLTSSVWTFDSDTRIVWFTFLMLAQSDGFVPGSVPGIANIAKVSEQAARDAIARFEAPDPDSRSTEYEGRRIVKAPRGWHILNYVAARERAKAAAERTRKAAWARKNYHSAPEPDPRQLSLPGIPADLAGPSDSLDAHKPKHKQSSPQKEKISDAPAAVGFRPVVLHQIPDAWQMDQELLEEAKAAGVERAAEHFERLKQGPIGGSRGVLPDKLLAYIRSQFPKWRTWEETDRAKANPGSAFAQRNRFGESHAPEAQPAAKRIPGLPGWVGEAHVKAAKERGVSIKAAIKGFAQSYHLPVAGLPPCDVHRPFLDYIESLAEGRAA